MSPSAPSLHSITADSIEGRSTLHQYFKMFHENYVEYAHKLMTNSSDFRSSRIYFCFEGVNTILVERLYIMPLYMLILEELVAVRHNL
ncbi:hypothetical protein ACS0TY_004546 [Phlomoides rotata]